MIDSLLATWNGLPEALRTTVVISQPRTGASNGSPRLRARAR